MERTAYVLVTGAGGDIGAALLSNLLQSGYAIVALDIKPPALTHPDIQYIRCDLARDNEIRQIIETGKEQWLPQLEGIVHLAGIYPNLSFFEYSIELWDQVFHVNVRSLYSLISHVMHKGAPRLRSIVVTSSAASKVGSRDPAYAASKAALNGLANNLSMVLSDQKIRVNTVLPGIIDTSMSKRQSEDRRAYHASRTLAKTIGKPEEVASVISFLISEASSYMWGASVDVNGGMSF
jgi:NAD(P)-dependent dehydrogenase (short-subunit alcohol dehydrogenase family)